MNPPTSRAARWITIGVLICLFLVFDFFMLQAFGFDADWVALILVGIYIGQINLMATWAALAPGNIVFRLPWCFLLCTLMWYALVLSNRSVNPVRFSVDDAALLGVILLGATVVAQIPLWVAGKVFGWQLVSTPNTVPEASSAPMQFQIRHMLLGMLLVSVALAPARAVLPPGEFAILRVDFDLPVLLSVVALCNLVITVPCIWGAFAKLRALFPLAIGWLLYGAVVTGIEYAVLFAILGNPNNSQLAFLIYLLNITQCGVVFGTLLILRAIGFRLIRVKAGGQIARDGVSSSPEASPFAEEPT